MGIEKTTQAAKQLIGRGRIIVGTGIYQDQYFGIWPQCCPPRSEYEGEEYQYQAKDQEMVFDVVWNGHYWDCRADGYGYRRSNGDNGEYGNGSIFVSKFDGVKLDIEQENAMREAIMQMLDDMGPDGHSICEAAKKMAMESVQAHYCPDWDYLPIGPPDPEMDGCSCNKRGG